MTSPPSQDGYGSGNGNYYPPPGAPATVSLTTANANDVLIFACFNENYNFYPGGGPNNTTPIATVTDTEDLTWTLRSQVSFPSLNGNAAMDLEVWWAHVATAYSGTITAAFTGSVDSWSALAFGVTGAGNPTSPWDTSGTLPASFMNDSNSSAGITALSGGDCAINSANSFFFTVGGSINWFTSDEVDLVGVDASGGAGIVYAMGEPPNNSGHESSSVAAEYQIFTAAKASLTPNFGGVTSYWGMIADAIAGVGGGTGAARRVFFVA